MVHDDRVRKTVTPIQRLRRLHASSTSLRDPDIDGLLGLRIDALEAGVFIGREQARWGDEALGYEGTPYNVIREALRHLALGDADVLYDLGSGYGRVVLYAALTGAGRFHGIELVATRVAEAERCARHLGLERRVRFSLGNAVDVDFSDATAFFLFNPFVPRTFEAICQRMYGLSRRRRLRIASYGPCGDSFARQPWLSERHPPDARHNHRFGLRHFRSR